MSWLGPIFADYPEAAWASIGVLFLIVEILLPMGFFLSFAASGFVVAVCAYAGILPETLLMKLVVFAAIGVALIVPFRTLLRRVVDRTPDINQY